MKGALKTLRLLFQGRKLMSEIEKADKQGFQWGINLRKALKAAAADVWKVVALALAGLILDPTFWTRMLEGNVPPAVLLAALPIIGAFTESGRNWLKHRFAIAPALLLALLLPVPVLAQPAPEDAPAPTLSAGALEVDLSGWTLAIVTKGEKREIAGGRVVIDYAISDRLRAFTRIDITGAQDFGSIEAFGEYSTFRAVETYGGLRYQIHPTGLAVAAVGGTSWSIEGKDGPLDPRMATALLLARVPLPGGGHAYVGGGHRGPVGGAALVASVTYPAGPTRLLLEYDLPLTSIDGQPRPGVLKTGVALPIKRWSLR